ncbi:MinD/ParA family protein [Thalassobacillus devorans]|uniref:MinD/ParA family protein n=1 Tax=Thalassobacillus devorans TaxID=279813 RepID=UPI00111C76FA|nr:MinD/ParA family protein [Thalassobacillus devorans]
MMHDQAQQLRDRMLKKKNREEHKAKTLAIISGKGGVGKSNFALNFSIALKERQQRVLLFDLDIGMGNIDILIGKSASRNLVDLFEGNVSLKHILTKGPEALEYIAGGSGLAELFQLDEHRFHHFLSEFEAISKFYDFVIFDMGAGVTNDSLKFILAAEEAILVTTPEPTALTDGYAILKYIHQLQRNMNIYMLINRASDIQTGKETLNRFQRAGKQFLNKELYPLGILPDDPNVGKAVVSQVPFLQFNRKSSASQALLQMTDQYLDGSITINRFAENGFVDRLKRLISLQGKGAWK